MDALDFGRCLDAAVAAGYAGPYTLIYESPDDDEWRALASALQEQLDRAVTNAFSGPFLLAAALALAALVPVAFLRGRKA